ncbi:uncharacterized protein MELLADRAFT_63912 [Melampsora larici-populina 98AG31]|uniref:Uncharacterized protein n=1 Tax=Melampsora larici-populina (strain 98AG31 / pathotype 3-4-7) TaxID=747676 RepID=F4RPF2_MELLP|nr:uncharacterized protein MELLADRAFT_63912 [Melampsora larici-populina 98AG31]EGG05515.1 hypothetical protein MELLADRAFT_63912 [Melampsora larici-populina 98AG31]
MECVGLSLHKIMAVDLKVSSHSPISGDDIAQSATTTLEYFRTEAPINLKSIGTPETHSLKISEGLTGSRNSKETQVPMDQSFRQKGKEIQQDKWNTMDMRYQEIFKKGPGSHSNDQEIVLFGKRIKVNPGKTINIRDFASHKMNRICMVYARYLVEEFTSLMIVRLCGATGLQPQSTSLKQYDNLLFAPFVYFILLRDPKKAVWDRLVAITSLIMVGFHQRESISGEIFSTKKLQQFMLWHTEMMYHLTNPKLLDYVNEQEIMCKQSSNTGMNRGRFPLSIILSVLSNQASFKRLFKQALRHQYNLAASYLQNFWYRDYQNHYPGSEKSDIPKISVEQEWNRISKSILESCQLNNRSDFFSALKELNSDEPMIGEDAMMLPLKNIKGPKDFNNDLSEIKLNQENLRTDLVKIKESNILQGLKVWMEMHERQEIGFSDPFCVTAVFDFLGSKRPSIDVNVFWKHMEGYEKSKKVVRKNAKHHYQKVVRDKQK